MGIVLSSATKEPLKVVIGAGAWKPVGCLLGCVGGSKSTILDAISLYRDR